MRPFSRFAFGFLIGREAWRMFTQGLGVDGDNLIRCNHESLVLEYYGEGICKAAPSAESLRATLAKSMVPRGLW